MKKHFSLILLLFPVLQLQAQNLSKEKKAANIESFAKVYGYVRYFHPSDEAAAINWEKFLYYGIREVENAPDAKVLNQKLTALFSPVAPSVRIEPAATAQSFDVSSITPADKSERKEITWQHYGLGNQDGLYKSIRTNREVTVNDPKRARFGVVTAAVDAAKYRGKKFRLKGSMKTEVGTGQGQMWVRIDREGNKMGFFNNMDDRPVKIKEWKEYEIAGKVDDDARQFLFGAFLVGDGKIWIDHFTLEVEDAGKWIPVPINNASFEEDHIKDWNSGSPGYVYKLVNDAAAEGKQSLMLSCIPPKKMVTTIYDAKKTFGDSFTKNIGNGLSCTVPLVLMGSAKATYPAADSVELQNFQDKIEKSVPPFFTANDLYVRLTGVAMAWNAFQHFYPYKEEAKLQWTKELPIALAAAYETKTPKEFGNLLRVLTEKLKDGHVSVRFAEQDYYSIKAEVALAEGKLIIAKVDSAAVAANKLSLKVGDIVESVDGKPALERFEMLKKRVSGSEQWKNARAEALLFDGNQDTEVELKIKRNDEGKDIKVLRTTYDRLKNKAKIRKLENGIYYINLDQTEMKDITAVLPELAKAKGIVCDLRGYPKGNHELIAHLLNIEDKDKWMFVPRLTYPDFEQVTYDEMGWELKPVQPHINAKVVFLTGGGAISYAESYMGFIKHYKLATIVGQPTAGANGNVNAVRLPGNYNIAFTGMKVKLHDGGQLHSIGIQPDVYVERTIKGVTEGRDEYLEKALDLFQ